jgi:hypothetical protein
MKIPFRLRSIIRLLFVALLCGGIVTLSHARGGGGGGGGGGAGTGSAGGSSASRRNTNPSNDADPTSAAIKSSSQAAEQAINLCDVNTPRCIADALDDYASALRKPAPLLPSELRDLPVIVERAATKVRTARNRKEAIVAVKNAIAEVHKSIALLKADDQISLSVRTRDSAFVVETLQVADNKLEKAVGL